VAKGLAKALRRERRHPGGRGTRPFASAQLVSGRRSCGLTRNVFCLKCDLSVSTSYLLPPAVEHLAGPSRPGHAGLHPNALPVLELLFGFLQVCRRPTLAHDPARSKGLPGRVPRDKR
jgi:hypothetical protein